MRNTVYASSASNRVMSQNSPAQFYPDLIWRGFEFRSRPNGTGTILTAADAAVGCGCDSAVGGALLQTRGESLVFGETEGEFRRERDPGCSSENRVSIFARISNFTATECHTGAVAPRRVLVLHTATWTLQTLIFLLCARDDPSQPPVGKLPSVVSLLSS